MTTYSENPFTLNETYIDLSQNTILTSDITITANNYFTFIQDHITFDGQGYTITINEVRNFTGLFKNGTGSNAYSNITIKNLNIEINGVTTLAERAGFLGQRYFGKGGSNILIENCHVIGNITTQYCGGIIESNTLHHYDSSNNSFKLISDYSDIKPNIGYWVKCTGSGQIRITPNSSNLKILDENIKITNDTTIKMNSASNTTSWRGDINTDSNIDANDAQYILNWVASGGDIGTEVTYSVNNQKYQINSQQITKIDFNNDFQVTADDAQYILNWIAAGGSIEEERYSVVYSVNGQTYTMEPNNSISLQVHGGLNLFYLSFSGIISGDDVYRVFQYDSSDNKYDIVDWTNSYVHASKGYFVDISSSHVNPSPISYSFNGVLPETFSINVEDGWNIIGWNSDLSGNGTITDLSGVILENTIHEYNVESKNTFGLVTNMSSIKPNIGYWVKCRDSGQLIITPNT
jgi:hypothetical protein